jgi:hypothetical protein
VTRREVRLCGLALIVGGGAGTVAVLLGYLPLVAHGDGTLAFPILAGLGVAVLHVNRPLGVRGRRLEGQR